MNAPKQELARKVFETERARAIKLAHERKDPTLWAQAVWCIRGDQNQPYRMTGFEFMKPILRDEAPMVSIMSSAGVGKTEGFIPWSLSRADRGRRVLYLSENDMKTSLIVQERVNPNFKASPYLQMRNAGEVDNIHLKKLGTGVVYFLGLHSDSVTRSYHGDDAVYDEFDAMEPTRIMDMQKRLASSTEPTIREISNPSQPDYGIHRRYKEGDMRRWHVRCALCKDWQPLDYQTHIDRKKRILICPKCTKPLVVDKADFVPTNPKGTHHSYHIHRLMSRALDVGKLCDDLASEDWRTVSAATRMDLGLPYEDKDSGLSDSDLQAALDPADLWTKHAPGGSLHCDPGGVFDVQIWTKREVGVEPRCCWMGTVSGWVELEHLILESGVAGGCIDYGPDGIASLEFCKRQRARGLFFVRVAYWMSEAPGQPDWKYDSQDALLLQANRTAVIDTMVLKVRKGQMKFPKRIVIDKQGRWAMHMKSPRRVVEYNDAGKAKTRWGHEETRPDHQFHVSVYASIYLEASKLKGGAELKLISKGTY